MDCFFNMISVKVYQIYVKNQTTRSLFNIIKENKNCCKSAI